MPSISAEFDDASGLKSGFTQKELDEMVHEAVAKDSVQYLRLALAAGGSAHGNKDAHRLRPLGLAILGNKPALARLLLAAGANPDEPVYPSGTTPLMLAVVHHAPEIIDALVVAKADLDKIDGQKRSALIIAAELADDVAVEKLLAAGADDSLKRKDGSTALQIARELLKQEELLTETGASSVKRILGLLEDAAAKPRAAAGKPAFKNTP